MKLDPTKKVYLGDSVYCSVENGMFKLTTENGMGPSNTIYLEPHVYESLQRYVERSNNHPETHDVSSAVHEQIPLDTPLGQFLSVLKVKGFFHLHSCSICGYECGYSFRGDQLGYDNGCYCSSSPIGWNPRDPNDLIKYIDHPSWDNKIKEFMGTK